MLDALRNSSRSWLAKGLLLLLVASFAVWGISGQIGSGVGTNTVVTAGETQVPTMNYRLAYDRQLAVLSRQLGERVSREQAQMFGVDRMVLGQMVAGAVLDEQARLMDLGLSKDRLAELVADDPAFRGVNGQFSRSSFRQVLANAGMTEEEYIRNQQEVATRQQIADAVSDGVVVPRTILQAVAQHIGETRDVEYVTLTESDVQPIPEPSDGDLQSFYDENQQDYVAPEYRTISYVRLTPEDIADPASIAEDEVRADYEARKERYTRPETRDVQQLVFRDEESATAARESIAQGGSFEEAVEAAGRTMSDVSLGTVEQSDIVDDAVAEAAFSLKSEGAVSDVVDGAFGPVIVRVTEINEESVQSYEEVADEIRQELALVQANDTLLDVHDAYEDARAAGNTMQEAASAQRLEVETIEAVDAEGRTPSGDTIDLPERDTLIEESFQSEVGIENPPLNAGQLGFLWYEVDDVTPSRQQDFEEVQDEVRADWIAQETDRLLDEQAASLAQELGDGEPLAEIAEAEGLQTQTKYGLKRGSGDADFGSDAVSEVFDGGSDHAGYVPSAGGNARHVFQVMNVSQPMAGIEAVDERTRQAVRDSVSNDLLDQVVAELQDKFAVTVNQNALDRALNYQ